MVTITDALTASALNDNAWARHALSTLGDEIDPLMPVVAAMAGWTLRRSAAGEELIDTLFVLTDTHLGFGQTSGGIGDPRWIPLTSITSLDAIDDSPLPLQTVEMSIDSTMAMLVGWPSEFTPNFVVALQRTLDTTRDAAMPWELSSDAAVAADPSGLDDLGPSAFTEQPVEPPPAGGGFSVGGDPTAPEPPPMFSAPAAADAPPTAPMDGGPGGFATTEQFEPAAPPFGGNQVSEEDPPDAPWMEPTCVWPEEVHGVTYRGGDPSVSRKKKGGSLAFGRRGLEVMGRGRRPWRISVGWSHIEDIDIQSADEIAFGSEMKIGASSSAILVTTTEGHRIVFEVAQRRPPSLRSTLAPATLMAATAKSWRAGR